MKPIIEIVSHCYAEKHPHYADALAYQLSSFVLHPPKHCIVIPTICHSRDPNTEKVLEWFSRRILETREVKLSVGDVGRRSIGRNIAAKSSKADIVWFADVDMVFDRDCLDTLAEMTWPIGVTMMFPSRLKISKDHATGDAALSKARPLYTWANINQDEYIDHSYNRAIGGVQIVRGAFARRYGYLPDHEKFQSPVDKPFGNFKDDIAYRTFCKSKGVVQKIELPNLFRIRHSTCSYDDKVQS